MTIKMEMLSWARKKLVDLFLKRINRLIRSGFSSIKRVEQGQCLLHSTWLKRLAKYKDPSFLGHL